MVNAISMANISPWKSILISFPWKVLLKNSFRGILLHRNKKKRIPCLRNSEFHWHIDIYCSFKKLRNQYHNYDEWFLPSSIRLSIKRQWFMTWVFVNFPMPFLKGAIEIRIPTWMLYPLTEDYIFSGIK